VGSTEKGTVHLLCFEVFYCLSPRKTGLRGDEDFGPPDLRGGEIAVRHGWQEDPRIRAPYLGEKRRKKASAPVR